jgi:hypothetical protein
VIVAGVDVGNSTTEVAFARFAPGRPPEFLLVLRTATSGPKGSLASASAARELVERGSRRLGEPVARLLLAELRAVETSLVERAHEDELDLGRTAVAVPASATPSGRGVGVGVLRRLPGLAGAPAGATIAIVEDEDFERAAEVLRGARERGWDLRGAIVRGDDAVLIGNRVDVDLPIVDEVARTSDLPEGALAAIEVAEVGGSVTELGDPLRLAVLLGLDPAEARGARNAARHALGNRCAVVALSARGSATVAERVVALTAEAPVDADDVFRIPLPAPPADAAFSLRLRRRRVEGIATLRSRPSEDLAGALDAVVVCAEPEAAMRGAATSPGAGSTPFVIDLGGGTVDLHRAGTGIVLAGAGELVTRVCAGILGCEPELAERAKRTRSVRVETPFILHHEDGSRSFRGEPAGPGSAGRLCLLEPRALVPLPVPLAPEVWRELRRQAKRAVLVANVRRALDRTGGVPRGELVTLVGGSATDHEVVEEVAAGLADLDVAVARGDVLGRHGPRAAVAVGLVLAFAEGR